MIGTFMLRAPIPRTHGACPSWPFNILEHHVKSRSGMMNHYIRTLYVWRYVVICTVSVLYVVFINYTVFVLYILVACI